MRAALAALLLLPSLALAKPPKGVAPAPAPTSSAPPSHDGSHAHVVSTAGSVEEATAKELEKLIRGQLGGAITGLFVVDAKTGEPLFSTNETEKLNPASNVKMISTATSLELLGADFHFPTRVLGPAPDDAGVLHGDVYLLGSWDPTLMPADIDALGAELATHGIHAIDGAVVIGADPTRDGLFRATVPITVTAGDSGKKAVAGPPDGWDLVTVTNTTTTLSYAAKPQLNYKATTVKDATGRTRIALTVSGTIGKGGKATYDLPTTERTADAAYALRAAMIGHGITVSGDVRVAELGDYIGDSVGHGGLPIELARHESAALADIVAHVNKWSINWLADRVVIAAAALHERRPATMESGVEAMYGWLARHAQVAHDDLVVDTGSGLSYKTKISPKELVAVVRGAGGFATTGGIDAGLARAWTESLSVGGKDGTLSYRFRTPDVRGRLVGKTGTLSTAIALSGILEVDPARPLVFSIVSNASKGLSAGEVRKTHEALVGAICRYLAKTSKRPIAVATPVPVEAKHPALPVDLEENAPSDDVEPPR